MIRCKAMKGSDLLEVIRKSDNQRIDIDGDVIISLNIKTSWKTLERGQVHGIGGETIPIVWT